MEVATIPRDDEHAVRDGQTIARMELHARPTLLRAAEFLETAIPFKALDVARRKANIHLWRTEIRRYDIRVERDVLSIVERQQFWISPCLEIF